MKLKKAYVRDLVNSSIINFIFKFCSFKNDGKILVKSMDGIGDILVRSRLAEKIIEKYGNENVYFLMKDHYKNIGEMLGYNVIGIPRKSEKNLFKRLKMMYQINKKYSPQKLLNIEFGNDSIIANISAKEKVGILDLSESVEKYNKYYTKYYVFKKENEKVLDRIQWIGENILETKLRIEDIYPDLRDRFNIIEKNIVIAVGSTGRYKICSPLKMAEYIKVLNEKFSNDEIVLVGNGDLQIKYAEKLIELLPKIKFKNMVNKTSLKEVFDLVAGSKIFVGFDSGLYNLCFTLRKKGIGLFRDTTVSFAHDVPWLKNIGPDEKEKIIFDEDYPDEKINKIPVKKFEKAMEELINE